MQNIQINFNIRRKIKFTFQAILFIDLRPLLASLIASVVTSTISLWSSFLSDLIHFRSSLNHLRSCTSPKLCMSSISSFTSTLHCVTLNSYNVKGTDFTSILLDTADLVALWSLRLQDLAHPTLHPARRDMFIWARSSHILAVAGLSFEALPSNGCLQHIASLSVLESPFSPTLTRDLLPQVVSLGFNWPPVFVLPASVVLLYLTLPLHSSGVTVHKFSRITEFLSFFKTINWNSSPYKTLSRHPAQKYVLPNILTATTRFHVCYKFHNSVLSLNIRLISFIKRHYGLNLSHCRTILVMTFTLLLSITLQVQNVLHWPFYMLESH